jgi:hypothetical protein
MVQICLLGTRLFTRVVTLDKPVQIPIVMVMR